MYKELNMMGYDVYIDSIDRITIEKNSKKIINTINPHSYITAKSDLLFREALLDSDVLIPDGSGMVVAANAIYRKKIAKIAGSDLHRFLLALLNESHGSVFYMGAKPATLDKIQERIAVEFPNVRVGKYSPPYMLEFPYNENMLIVEHINSFHTDVLFVGMTAPRQEKWLHANKNQLNFKIASSIGAVFDFYAGTVKRPSQYWIDIHLEWFPRLLKEPRRLWKRNFISTPLFLLDTILYKMRKKL